MAKKHNNFSSESQYDESEEDQSIIEQGQQQQKSQYQNKNQKKLKKNIQFQAKIILLGESTVGKTSILEQYSNNQFQQFQTLTIGVDFRVTEHKVDNGTKDMRLKIWDTSGQERFRAIAESFYKGAHGVCLIFDLNSTSTFEKIEFWVKSIQDKSDNTEIVKILIGNKSDLEQKVREKDIQNLSQNNGLKYFQTSAKTGQGLKEVFDYMANATFNTFGDRLFFQPNKGKNNNNTNGKNNEINDTNNNNNQQNAQMDQSDQKGKQQLIKVKNGKTKNNNPKKGSGDCC